MRSIAILNQKVGSGKTTASITLAAALGILVANALVGVREVIIPVGSHRLVLPGINHVIHAVENLRNNANPDLRIVMIVPCRVAMRTRHSGPIVRILRR